MHTIIYPLLPNPGTVTMQILVMKGFFYAHYNLSFVHLHDKVRTTEQIPHLGEIHEQGR